MLLCKKCGKHLGHPEKASNHDKKCPFFKDDKQELIAEVEADDKKELVAEAKALGIKATHLMSIETLKEKIAEKKALA